MCPIRPCQKLMEPNWWRALCLGLFSSPPPPFGPGRHSSILQLAPEPTEVGRRENLVVSAQTRLHSCLI